MGIIYLRIYAYEFTFYGFLSHKEICICCGWQFMTACTCLFVCVCICVFVEKVRDQIV